jgi:hypothetical protein
MMRLDDYRSLDEGDAASGNRILRFCINNYKNTTGTGCQPRDPAAQFAMFCQSVG